MSHTMGRSVVIGLAVWLSALASGGSAVTLEAQGAEAPTFHRDVLPILQRNCQSCHRPGQIGPMSLLTYQDARPWARSIKARVVAREMPPWFANPQYNHFANDRRLSDRDMATLVRWVDEGAVQGNPDHAPPPAKWPAEGWQIPPDVIVGGVEFPVPAAGIVEWITVTVPSGFTKDTWVTSIEVRPSALAVTHHICVTYRPHDPKAQYGVAKWDDKPRDATGSAPPRPKVQPTALEGENLGGTQAHCYLPGNSAADFRPYRAAKLIPAGSDLVFSMHYTTNGTPAVDRPRIGFTVANERPERQFVTLSVTPPADGESFAIPPNDPNWQSPPGKATLLENAQLVAMTPHMHDRGKDMVVRLDYADGRSDTVLHVPNYDYNWQLIYEPVAPIPMPRGTRIRVDAHFNNSTSNPLNRHPNRTVYWGDQQWEEMMGSFVGLLVDTNVDPKKILRRDD